MDVALSDPWLVAVWPGMGAVAQIAAGYLVNQLGARPLETLDPGDFFDVRSVRTRDGLMAPAELPRSVFYGWKAPTGGRDLLVFVGEQQPAQQGFHFCQLLLERAVRHGVRRVCCFAAMAAPIDPRARPKVYAAASSAELLAEVRAQKVVVLGEGEITGLNGILPAVAAARGLEGLCLLGEIPFYASATPNPKAAAAVLRVFTGLAGIRLDLTDLDKQGKAVEAQLVRILERLQQSSGAKLGGEEPEEEYPSSYGDEEEEEESTPGEPPAPEPIVLAPEVEARIESLFALAEKDRGKALELKAELDRQGVFKQYEDRFLDLFKKAG